MKKYLIVVAHPDDEVMGAGATIKKFTENGDAVDLCIMSTQAQARATDVGVDELFGDLENCSKFLGVNQIFKGTFPNIEMNTVTHLALVQFIEKAISESNPDIIITHHSSDVNNDHYQTFIACQAAIRLFQRRDNIKPIEEVWLMEVLSSTDWSIDPMSEKFTPNIFVEIGDKYLSSKLKALDMYRGVLRDYPHPRSEKGLTGLAIYRGGQVGLDYAEAFDCVFRRIK